MLRVRAVLRAGLEKARRKIFKRQPAEAPSVPEAGPFDPHVLHALLVEDLGRILPRFHQAVVSSDGQIEQAKLGVDFGSECRQRALEFRGIDGVAKIWPTACCRIGQHRDIDQHTGQQRQAAAEDAHRGEIVEVVHRGIERLRAAARQPGNGAVVSVHFEAQSARRAQSAQNSTKWQTRPSCSQGGTETAPEA
jgi:hypothetical protein